MKVAGAAAAVMIARSNHPRKKLMLTRPQVKMKSCSEEEGVILSKMWQNLFQNSKKSCKMRLMNWK